MANIKLEDLYLSKEESRYIIELLAKKRNIILDQVISYIISLKSNLKIKKNRRYKRRIKKLKIYYFKK